MARSSFSSAFLALVLAACSSDWHLQTTASRLAARSLTSLANAKVGSSAAARADSNQYLVSQQQQHAAALVSQAAAGPSDFPYTPCQRDATQSRYSLSDATVSPLKDGDADSDLTRICFSVEAADIAACSSSGGSGGSAPAACCEFDLQKVEFDVSSECYGALSYVSVAGAARPPFFASSAASAATTTIKVVNLNLRAGAAGGTEICLFMRPQCSTLQQLCRRPDGRCQYGIFGAQPVAGGGQRCCPVGLAGTLSVGPENMAMA